MKNVIAKTAILFAVAFSFQVAAQGGGTLGGNPSADSGAVNVGVGKCVQYKIDAKKDNTVVKPEGC